MNNSFLAIESIGIQTGEPADVSPKLEEREGELVTIIDAIQTIKKSKEWITLKEKIFADLAERLTKDLLAEAREDTPDRLKLARLSGQLFWAEGYADLDKLEERYRKQLSSVRHKLHGTKD